MTLDIRCLQVLGRSEYRSVLGKYLQDSSYFMEDAMPELKWSRKDLYGQGISKVDITQPDHNVDKAMLNILDCVLV